MHITPINLNSKNYSSQKNVTTFGHEKSFWKSDYSTKDKLDITVTISNNPEITPLINVKGELLEAQKKGDTYYVNDLSELKFKVSLPGDDSATCSSNDNNIDESCIYTIENNINDNKKRRKLMKNYINPEIEIVELSVDDVITTSPGTETPWYEENDGIWELNINP